MKRELIYAILKQALSDHEVGFEVFEGLCTDDWAWAYKVLSIHGLAGFVCRVIDRMPENIRPPKTIVLKYISANMAGTQSYVRLKDLAEKIDGVLKNAGVKCLLLKGLSLAEYYPNPESRKFLDIDLYAPGMELCVDEAFKTKGVEVDTEFYRHSHMTLGGVLVENHHFLLDVRGRKKLAELDADLKNMAVEHLSGFDSPGLYYPDAKFSLIFNLHHAMSHFIYEGISFKFLLDWIFFLKREYLTVNQLSSSLRKHGLLKFAAVMSEVCVRHLGLAMDEVPEYIREEMAKLKPSVVERFIDDLFRPYEKVHQKNLVAERYHSVCRIVNASWKPKEFLGQSAIGFIWGKFLPILMGQKVEAD